MKRITHNIKIIIIFAIIISISPVNVLAYRNNTFYSSNNILFYDDEATGYYCVESLVGNDNIEKALRYFIGKGLTLEQASGILGNLMKESTGINPTAIQSSSTVADENYRPEANVGFGIAQWTSEGRQKGLVDFMESDSSNRSIIDLSLQLDYLWYELSNNYKSALESLKEQTDPVESAIIFHDKYEKSADSDEVVRNDRGGYATQIYNNYNSENLAYDSPGLCLGSNYATNFSVLNQNDPEWEDKPYGSSTIGASGCGPTAMAMIINALTGESLTPVDTATYGAENGTFIENVGSSSNIGKVIGSNWGLESESIDIDIASVDKVLNSGGLVLASGTGSAPYTSSGHFIVIRAVTNDGKWLIADSNGEIGIKNSEKEWSPESVISNTKGLWAITK